MTGLRGRRWMVGAAALLLLFLVFDWNWFRRPVEAMISNRTGRAFSIEHLDVDLGFAPVIKLQGVVFQNADWARTPEPMARIGSLEFSVAVSIEALREGRLLVPRAALSKADLVFERAADKRKNWVLKPAERTAELGLFRIGSVSMDDGRVRYLDHGEPLMVDIQVHTFAPGLRVTEARAPVVNTGYATRLVFNGNYHGGAFQGEAQTGEVVSFRETGIVFPMQGEVRAGSTRAQVEGRLADVREFDSIDVNVRAAGASLADLSPFLPWPLPASSAYTVAGHVVRAGERYQADRIEGRLGSTDIAGSGSYLRQEPRPLLTASLHSKVLDLRDIVALARTWRGPDATTPATAAPGPARANSAALEGGRAGPGWGSLDADVDYAADRFKASPALPVEHLKLALKVRDAVAHAAPLEIGVAGGRLVSDIRIDASQAPRMRSTISADLRGAQIAALLPRRPGMARGSGELEARLRLAADGRSMAESMATSQGSLTASLHEARISNLLDAGASLNAGKAVALLVGGDTDIAVRCAGMVVDIREGLGRAQLLVVDTEQTRIDGRGGFDLKRELIDVTLQAVPKKPGILSFRAPVNVQGSLWRPQVEIERAPVAARAGAAAVLALINPLAGLLPLLDSGGGRDADCARVRAQVQRGPVAAR